MPNPHPPTVSFAALDTGGVQFTCLECGEVETYDLPREYKAERECPGTATYYLRMSYEEFKRRAVFLIEQEHNCP